MPLCQSHRMWKADHAQLNIEDKLNLRTKVGICISSYSNADVVCYSATWWTELKDVRLIEARPFVRNANMMTHGWKCRTRAVSTCDIFNRGFIIFGCRTHYRASSVYYYYHNRYQQIKAASVCTLCMRCSLTIRDVRIYRFVRHHIIGEWK